MRHFIAVVVAAFFLAMAGQSEAQYTTYLPALPPDYVYVYPTQPTYVQSYQTVVPRSTRPDNSTANRNRPYYGTYGYGNYSNGSSDGFPPFRGWRNR